MPGRRREGLLLTMTAERSLSLGPSLARRDAPTAAPASAPTGAAVCGCRPGRARCTAEAEGGR